MPHQQYDPTVAAKKSAPLPNGASNTYKSEHFTIRYADNDDGIPSEKEDSLKKLAVEIVLHGPALLQLLKGSEKERDRDPFLAA